VTSLQCLLIVDKEKKEKKEILNSLIV